MFDLWKITEAKPDLSPLIWWMSQFDGKSTFTLKPQPLTVQSSLGQRWLPQARGKDWYWSSWEVKSTFNLWEISNTDQNLWRKKSPFKSDPITDFFNSRAPEWLRVDPEDTKILWQFAKEDYPDLTREERILKAVEYLPALLEYKKSKQPVVEPKPESVQGSRFTVPQDKDTNIFWIPKIPRFNDMQDISVKEWASRWEVLKQFAKNFWKSTVNLASDISNFMLDPVDSAINIIKLAGWVWVNTVELLSWKEFWWTAWELWDAASLAWERFLNRYWWLEEFSKASFEDPVWVFSDLVSILWLWWTWISKLTTKWSKLSNVWQSLQKVGSLDPANKVVSFIWKWYNKVWEIGQPKKPVIYTSNDVRNDIMKWFRPWVNSVKESWSIKNYVDQAWEWAKSVTKRLDNIELESNWELIKWKLPETIQEFSDSIPQAKKQIYQEYIKEAEAAWDVNKINTSSIISDLEELKWKMWKIINSQKTIKYIDSIINDLKSKWDLDILDALDNTEALNARLKAYYRNPNPNQVSNMVVDNLLNNHLRKAINETIDVSLSNSKYAWLKKEYWNLKAIEKDIMRRATVEWRKAQKWFFDVTDIISAWEAFNALITMSPWWVVKAWIMTSLKELYKYLNNPDTNIKNLFKKAKETIETSWEKQMYIDAQSRRLQKALPFDEWAMTFWTPQAKIWNINPQWEWNFPYWVTEAWMENVKQPINPLQKALPQQVQRTEWIIPDGGWIIPRQMWATEVDLWNLKKNIELPQKQVPTDWVRTNSTIEDTSMNSKPTSEQKSWDEINNSDVLKAKNTYKFEDIDKKWWEVVFQGNNWEIKKSFWKNLKLWEWFYFTDSWKQIKEFWKVNVDKFKLPKWKYANFKSTQDYQVEASVAWWKNKLNELLKSEWYKWIIAKNNAAWWNEYLLFEVENLPVSKKISELTPTERKAQLIKKYKENR